MAAPLDEQARAAALISFNRHGPSFQDGSHLVFRELGLAYSLPRSLLRGVRARDGELLLAGRNLALLWKASTLPFESQANNNDAQHFTGFPGSATYWLLRANLRY